MEKPIEKHQNEPAYDWLEIHAWIKEKYGRDIDNWSGYTYQPGDTKPYQNFWHWLTDCVSINNGSYFYLNLRDDDFYDPTGEYKAFVPEILSILDKEFPEADGEMHCWVSW